MSISSALPSRHVYPASSGELVDETGAPVFLISTTVKYPCLQDWYKHKDEFVGTYPDEYEWLYGRQTSVPMLERCGFNALSFCATQVAYRSLAPDYAGFGKEDAWSDYEDMIKRYGWAKLLIKIKPTQQSYGEFLDLIRSARNIPVYLSLHQGVRLAALTQNRDTVKNLINPEQCFASPDKHPAFSIRYALWNKEARGILLKMYRHEVQTVLSCGIRPFVYKLFNEPDYKDYSPKNRRTFKLYMKKKYRDVRRLNRAWKTSYRSFEQMAKSDDNARNIEFKKYLELQMVQLASELRAMIRELDPGASTIFQVHHNAYRKNWNNFNLYLLNQGMDFVSTGTGNYNFSLPEHADDSIPFRKMNSPSMTLREDLGRSCFFRALADGKPLVASEAYFAGCGERYHEFKKAFWHEMIYGSNMVNMWEWIGYWLPKQKHNRISYGLHNQNVVSPDSWKALDDVKKEIETVRDFFQYRANRPKSLVACLFSYPTLRANQNLMEAYLQGISGLTWRHIPVDAILEEQLKTGRQNRYKVIVALGVKNVYPETNAALKQYVAEGGTLIVGGSYLDYDEYDNPLSRPLVGLKKDEGEGKLRHIPEIDIDLIDSDYFVSVPRGWKTVYAFAGQSFVLQRNIGKGRIIALAGAFQDNGFTELIAPVLNECGVRPVADLRRHDSNDRPGNIGAHRADHDGMTAWYFVNYNDEPKLVRVSAAEFRNAVAVNHLNEEQYPVAGDTISLLIPPQYHQVVVTGPQEKVEKQFGHFAEVSPDELKKRFDAQMLELEKTRIHVRPSAPLDISKFANYGFDNQQGWDIETAWFDSRGKDLKRVPYRGSVFKNLKFDIIRFDYNGNKTCIALKSKNLPEAPDKVEGIPLNDKLRGLAILHAVTHAKAGEIAMTYRFSYVDGTYVEVPVRVGRDIGDWRISENPSKIQKACAWRNSSGLGFFIYEWNNPQPSKTLKSFSIISGNGESVPIVVAVSSLPTRFRKSYENTVDLSKTMIANFNKKANGWHEDGTLHKNGESLLLTTPNGKPLPIPPESLKTAVLRFQVKFGCDKWGKQMPVQGYLWPFVVGIINGKMTKTDPPQSSRGSDRLVIKFREFRPSEWNEVEFPLGPLLKTDSAKSAELNNIVKLAFWDNRSYQIFRDVRIEY